MLLPVSVTSCGVYHPYKYLGERNPRCDDISRLMMDFKNEGHRNYQRAINRFSQLAIETVRGLRIPDDHTSILSSIPFLLLLYLPILLGECHQH